MSGVLQYFSLQALCPLRDVPSLSNHGDPLSYYQTGDLVRGNQFHHINKKVTVVIFMLVCIALLINSIFLFFKLESRILTDIMKSLLYLYIAHLFHHTYLVLN